MEIADAQCHQTLGYIAAVQAQGIKPSAALVRAYAERGGRPTRTLKGLLDINPAFPSFPAGLTAPRKVRENPLIWLYRVGWIDIVGPNDEEIEDDDEVSVTPLGRAALAALDEQQRSLGEEGPLTISLDKGDPLALAKVVGAMGALGPCALVDRYFTIDAFIPIAQRTEVTRVLTGPKPKDRVSAIEQALTDYSIDRDFEIRVDDKDEHHDRFVIPDEGAIWAMGTSVSGVGVRHSMLTEIKDEGATKVLRQNFEKGWKAGRTLNPAKTPTPSAEPKKEDPADSGGK